MTWTAPPVARPSGPLSGDDGPMIRGYLDWQRATLLDRCAGLTGRQLAERAVPPSNLSLLGLLRHLAKVERIWLRQRFAGEPVEPLHDADRKLDTDFDVLDPLRAEQDYAALVSEIRLADKAVAGASLDDTVEVGGETFSLRMIYLHLCGEYARHNGHADLLRERVDGRTGA
ncbi:DUF664 domain-containing protein [Prauserella muralis]|uniref:Mini-circle protein n=1 Tax=Prauserella muralis TaxID=588067 RepID=A0A2V4AQD9_9PSEU|nr:DUF664 domain-containing protein [Prauserella muralis]PXY22579.1 Mini-circle protein [Prauserella muralis]